MKRSWLIIGAMAFLWAGCGSSGGSSFTPTPPPVFSDPTTASVAAVDCARQLAYVPIAPQNATDAEVAVLDLSVDPDTTDPRVATVDLGHGGTAIAAAIDPKRGLALIISSMPTGTGLLDEIAENGNSLAAGSPFSFPTGSDPGPSDGIIYDRIHDGALVSMTSQPAACPGASTTACTGTARFDLATNSFEPIIQFDNPVDNFAFDPRAQIAIAPSDNIDPIVNAVDVKGSAGCTLTDGSLTNLNADPDGAAVDPNTGIWVIGNFNASAMTAINLAGATFSGTTPPCALQEYGAPPSNSVNLVPVSGVFAPGVAINPVTHQAVLTAADANQIGLLSLPKHRVKFIGGGDFSAVGSSLPLEPDGKQFQAANFPYSVTIDTCHNRAYILNVAATFLAEVDLGKLQSDPSAISTPLPAGNCVGTATTLACDNQNGVRFFPLPGI